MFHWKNKKKEKHDEEQHDYALTFDNVAIPEVHTHKTHEEMTENENEQDRKSVV